jgi:uncharacterized tellurite resistance protein B-like protein
MYLENIRSRLLEKFRFGSFTQPSVIPSALYSSVELVSQQGSAPLFVMKIRGSIHSPVTLTRTTVQVTIADITDGPENPQPVYGSSKQWQLPDSQRFCFVTELGPLPASITTLANWTTIAQIDPNWLNLPRSGKRTLQFSISIFGFDNPVEVASSDCIFFYESPTPGFVDLLENTERSKILTVTLAFTVGCADGLLSDSEVELIRKWARRNINPTDNSDNAKKQLERALNRTITLLRSGNTINAERVCIELARIATLAFRLDIMEFCLLVAKTGGAVSRTKLDLLKNISNWLGIDKKEIISLIQKILPPDICEIQDIEMFLGVRSDMSSEQTRLMLNEQYKKWSARVTNFDPQVRRQAASMLRLIAQTRNQLVK